MANRADLLSIESLRAGYGEAVVLPDMTLRLKEGEVLDHVSIIGSHFLGRIEETTSVGDIPGVVNSISGRAWLTGIAQYGVDPDDPYPCGYTLPDTWFS